MTRLHQPVRQLGHIKWHRTGTLIKTESSQCHLVAGMCGVPAGLWQSTVPVAPGTGNPHQDRLQVELAAPWTGTARRWFSFPGHSNTHLNNCFTISCVPRGTEFWIISEKPLQLLVSYRMMKSTLCGGNPQQISKAFQPESVAGAWDLTHGTSMRSLCFPKLEKSWALI